MFSRSKQEGSPSPQTVPQSAQGSSETPSVLFEPKPAPSASAAAPASVAPKAKPAPSVLSSDLTIIGNVKSSGDIQVEGIVEGDVRAQMLIVGESATVKGEVMAEEVIVHGRVVGRLRGLKVRLSASARCEGDIVHKTIAIESGAHFEGSVQRQEDPLGKSAKGDGRPGAVMAAE